jgi:hypothetical protein
MRRRTLAITHDGSQNDRPVDLTPASTLRRGCGCLQNAPQARRYSRLVVATGRTVLF